MDMYKHVHIFIMDKGIFHPPAYQNMCDQDGKQEISLNWPDTVCNNSAAGLLCAPWLMWILENKDTIHGQSTHMHTLV